MKLALAEAVAVTGATARDCDPGGPPLRIVTDTRTIERGDAFLALRGPTFDGHAFVAHAFDRGARYAIVADSASVPHGAAALIVDDTLRAYLALAGAARSKLGIPIVAITGSTGKTTTKHLLAQLLRAAGVRAAATPENENNEIGVSKFFLAREAGGDDVAIVEMGARHYGDIATLAAVARPSIGVLTNVGDAHVEIMGSRERLAETKWAIFFEDAEPVANITDAVTRERRGRFARAPHWFGSGTAAFDAATALMRRNDAGPFASITIVRDASHVVALDGAGRRSDVSIEARLPGEQNLANLAAALAAAQAFRPLENLAPFVQGLTLPPGRYERSERAGVTVVYDAYNASASGTHAALRTFAQEPAARRIVVFGGMAELGDDAAALHASVGEAAAQVPGIVLLAGGDYGDATAEGALRAGLPSASLVRYTENEEAAAWLSRNARPGDAVLLKGSRRYRMEHIREAFLAEGARA